METEPKLSPNERERYLQATLEVEHLKHVLRQALEDVKQIQAEQAAMLTKMAAQCRMCRTLTNLIGGPLPEEPKGPPNDEQQGLEQKLSDWH